MDTAKKIFINRKVKIQKDMNHVKPTGNICDHLNTIQEVIDTQKIKKIVKEVSRQKCKDALNKLKICVNKMKISNQKRRKF